MRFCRVRLGDADVIGFSAGEFLVDGGAMFGAVPRDVWRKLSPPGPDSRVPLSLNCFLIKTPGALVLADTGAGTLLNRRYLEAYRFQGTMDIPEALSVFGYAPEDVDIVFNSHLHFDHCGGNMRKDARGELVPAFPRARYIIRKGEWANALHPVARDKPSYFPAGLKALEASGRLELLDGDREIADGIDVFLVPGHTEFHQCLRISASGGVFVVMGDLVPTAAHAGLDAIMSFDLFPAMTMKTKKAFYGKALAGDWLLGLSHDPEHFFGRLRKTGSRYRFESRS